MIWPSYLATHGTEQTLYFNDDGLLARHDYEVEINGNTSAAHYFSDYDDIAGIRLPTKHRILPRTADGQRSPNPFSFRSISAKSRLPNVGLRNQCRHRASEPSHDH